MTNYRRLTIFIVALFSLACAAQLQAQVGIVERIRPPVYWQKDMHSRTIELNRTRDVGRSIFPGERVRCGLGGQLTLRLYNRKLQFRGPNNWFPVPHAPADKTDPKLQALREYNRRAGGDRGDTTIYQPANGSKIRPEEFEIRWTSIPNSEMLTIVVREVSPSGQEILRDSVNGSTGRLISDGGREALLEYRSQKGHGPLLVMLLGRREPHTATFFLLSVPEGSSLARDLRRWDMEPAGIWRHLGRAYSFSLKQMFTEASEEYEAALALAPHSTHLLERAIYAHRRTGNRARELGLVTRLPAGTSLP